MKAGGGLMLKAGRADGEGRGGADSEGRRRG